MRCSRRAKTHAAERRRWADATKINPNAVALLSRGALAGTRYSRQVSIRFSEARRHRLFRSPVSRDDLTVKRVTGVPGDLVDGQQVASSLRPITTSLSVTIARIRSISGNEAFCRAVRSSAAHA